MIQIFDVTLNRKWTVCITSSMSDIKFPLFLDEFFLKWRLTSKVSRLYFMRVLLAPTCNLCHFPAKLCKSSGSLYSLILNCVVWLLLFLTWLFASSILFFGQTVGTMTKRKTVSNVFDHFKTIDRHQNDAKVSLLGYIIFHLFCF